MKDLLKPNPVFIVLNCLWIMAILSSVAANAFRLDKQFNILNFLPLGINLLFIALLFYIILVLLALNESKLRSISFGIYFLAVFFNSFVGYFATLSVDILAIVGVITILIEINLMIQSYKIKVLNLRTGFIIFGWTVMLNALIHIGYPMLVVLVFKNYQLLKFSIISELLPAFALLHLNFLFYNYLNNERMKIYYDKFKSL